MKRRIAARFTARILVRCQPSLVAAIDRAAGKNLMTPSEYIRRSVIDRLKTDRIVPALYKEIERLRAVLQEIADMPATLEVKIDIARRALEPKP